jgi:small subunit ribosomal protein S4e
MAQKGPRKGLKRSKAPKNWKIARKEKKWTINPRPGPHNKEAIPLAFIIRDYLGYAHTMREVKQILSERKVKINGKVRTDYKFPVSVLDVVEIPLTNECYRILLNEKGNFVLHPITGEETHINLLKIMGKHLVKGAKTQLAFHDGTTLLADKKEYATFGTVVYDFESRTILQYIPFAIGNYGMITAGRNVSKSGTISSIKGELVEIEGEETCRTIREKVFVIGAKESCISLGD